jgi:hypothetical protein
MTGIKVTITGKQIEKLLVADLSKTCKSYVPAIEVEHFLNAKPIKALDNHSTKFIFRDQKERQEYLIEVPVYDALL